MVDNFNIIMFNFFFFSIIMTKVSTTNFANCPIVKTFTSSISS